MFLKFDGFPQTAHKSLFHPESVSPCVLTGGGLGIRPWRPQEQWKPCQSGAQQEDPEEDGARYSTVGYTTSWRRHFPCVDVQYNCE